MNDTLATQIDLAEIVETFEISKKEDLQDRILQLDALLLRGEQVDCPLQDEFMDGLYVRERFVPIGTLFTTYTWKHTHPFFCNIGELLIWDDTHGWQEFKAPCRGITLAGTKRIVYAITDVVWTTVHANPNYCETREQIEAELFENYQNPYLSLNELKTIQK